MIFSVEVSHQAKADITQHIKDGNKKLAQKVVDLMTELKVNPQQRNW